MYYRKHEFMVIGYEQVWLRLRAEGMHGERIMIDYNKNAYSVVNHLFR